MTETTAPAGAFDTLGLSPQLLSTVNALGYETPSPVQQEGIPALLSGKDIIAQAQTGTGKTAAFALPILEKIDTEDKTTQALVLAPTRELAIQVAEAMHSYAKGIKGFHVTPIYGGQDYQIQLRALKRGSHVIVGTPGRIMDHMNRGTLSIQNIKTVVLDEADEMLRMGFVEDIEWILSQIEVPHQTALFSATMPTTIKKIAKSYLKDPQHIKIKSKAATVDSTEQHYICSKREQKLEALTRYLEIEDIQAAILFVRTKTYSTELTQKLQARGYLAAALNGDMSQLARERTIAQLKKNQIQMVVATDVAARGIDIAHMTHVINVDLPHDSEAYIHRIGRTGRAGRTGKALSLITPRERRLLKDIERDTGSPIKPIEAPTAEAIVSKRNQDLANQVKELLNQGTDLKLYHTCIAHLTGESEHSAEDIAAALAYLLQSPHMPSFESLEAKPQNEYSRSRSQGEGRRYGNGDKPSFKKRRNFDDAPRFNKYGSDDKPAYKKRRDNDDAPRFKKYSSDDKPTYKKRRDNDDAPRFKKYSSDDKPAYKKRRDNDDEPRFKKYSSADKPVYKKRRDNDDEPRFKTFKAKDKSSFKKRKSNAKATV